MLKQFNKNCSTYHLLPEYQSAYWENHSYETALIKLVNNALWLMERKKVTALIAIDLSATLIWWIMIFLISVFADQIWSKR